MTVSACTVISHSLLKPGTYTGLYPSEEHGSWLRNTAVVRHLAALLNRVRKLEAKEKQRG